MVGRAGGASRDRSRHRWRALRAWILVALVLSIGAGAAREVIQNWGDAENDLLDSAADLLAWSIGASISAAVCLAVAWRLTLGDPHGDGDE